MHKVQGDTNSTAPGSLFFSVFYFLKKIGMYQSGPNRYNTGIQNFEP